MMPEKFHAGLMLPLAIQHKGVTQHRRHEIPNDHHKKIITIK